MITKRLLQQLTHRSRAKTPGTITISATDATSILDAMNVTQRLDKQAETVEGIVNKQVATVSGIVTQVMTRTIDVHVADHIVRNVEHLRAALMQRLEHLDLDLQKRATALEDRVANTIDARAPNLTPLLPDTGLRDLGPLPGDHPAINTACLFCEHPLAANDAAAQVPMISHAGVTWKVMHRTCLGTAVFTWRGMRQDLRRGAAFAMRIREALEFIEGGQ